MTLVRIELPSFQRWQMIGVDTICFVPKLVRS